MRERSWGLSFSYSPLTQNTLSVYSIWRNVRIKSAYVSDLEILSIREILVESHSSGSSQMSEHRMSHSLPPNLINARTKAEGDATPSSPCRRSQVPGMSHRERPRAQRPILNGTSW